MMDDCEYKFHEYVGSVKKKSLHPKLNTYFDTFPSNIKDLRNIIFYGPPGVGKYSQVLYLISKYSTLVNLNSNQIYSSQTSDEKHNYDFKVSDVHVEINMDMLGCNSKTIWNDIYNQLLEMAESNNNSTLIVVCYNFHKIHSELLDVFYTYMSSMQYKSKLVYFIVTEHVGFIPDNIFNNCQLIEICTPKKGLLQEVFGCQITKSVHNLKSVKTKTTDLITSYELLCDNITKSIVTKCANGMDVRDMLYDILLLQFDIYECVWYIVSKLYENKFIKIEKMDLVFDKLFHFFNNFNNNFRPIFHLEFLYYSLVEIIHDDNK